MDIFNKNIMIVGKGLSGVAAFEALQGIANPFFYQEDLKQQNPDLIVISPGIGDHPILNFAKKNKITIRSEIELGYILDQRFASSKIVAVTGTNGKTSLTQILQKILSKSFFSIACGNIGVPFSQIAKIPHKISIVEVSSFQLERCKTFSPNIAIITNITPDHLDRHKTMKNYIAAKMRIAQSQTPSDFFILPSILKKHIPKSTKSQIIFYDLECQKNDGYIYYKSKKAIKLTKKFGGQHNYQNLSIAAIVSGILGISKAKTNQALADFEFDAHRIQLIKKTKQRRWFDDSKATNIAACLAACEAMDGETALILGGSDKGYDYQQLFKGLPAKIKHIFITGQTAQKMLEAAAAVYQLNGKKTYQPNTDFPQITLASDLKSAVALSSKTSAKNILLSPAAASFDCFKDYKDRGNHFKKFVEELE